MLTSDWKQYDCFRAVKLESLKIRVMVRRPSNLTDLELIIKINYQNTSNYMISDHKEDFPPDY